MKIPRFFLQNFLSGKVFFHFLFAVFWLFYAGFSHAQDDQEEAFAAWVRQVKVEALEEGISRDLLDQVFTGVTLNDRVLELNSRQPEFTQTYQDYSNRRLSDTRITKGREMMIRYKEELEKVGEAYGVQPRFIVAIWGLETNYGGYIGGHNVIQALATLGFGTNSEGRKRFFRKELLMALKILQEGHIAPEDMKGSWAGAMGQGQFMPSSFMAYARDFDEDGRKDIWTTPVDIFASIANYLDRHRWRDDLTWGRQVTLPENFEEFEGDIQKSNRSGCGAENSHSKLLPLSKWNEMGIRRLNGQDLPNRDVEAALLRPAGDSGPAYLVYSNFVGLLRYNCSNFYALTVSRLSDLVARAP